MAKRHERIAKLLTEAVPFMAEVSFLNDDEDFPRIIGTMGFKEEAVHKVRSAVEVLYEDNFYRSNYSRRELERHLYRLLIKVGKNSPHNLQNFFIKEVQSLLKALSKEPEQFVFFIPIDFLRLIEENIDLGEVILHPVGKELDQYIKDTFNLDIDPIISLVISSKGRQHSHQTVAEVCVRALDVELASKKADSKLNLALSVIRLFIHPFEVFIQGERPNVLRKMDIINVSQKTFGSSSSWLRPFYPDIVMKPEIIAKMRAQGFNLIEEIMRKPEEKRTETEKNIITAIFWYGESIKDENPTSALVKAITALEALIVQADAVKKQNLAERIAFLLFTDAQRRKDTYKKIGIWYDLRNDIVHKGLLECDEYVTKELQAYTRSVILQLLRNKDKYPSLNKFIEWVQEQKFA